MVVRQYPHKITATWGNVSQDENGDWITSSGGTFESDCRAEPNGEGKTLTGEDGSQLYFHFSVYLPKTSEIIPVGAQIKIELAKNSVVKSTLKRQHNGQFNTQLWV